MPKKSRRVITIGDKTTRGTQTRMYKRPNRVAKKYAYANKRRMAAKNAPLKETKNRTDEEVHARFAAGQPAAYYNQNPLVFHPFPTADKVFPLKMFSLDAQQQGIDEDMLIGKSCFAKYLKMKIHLEFPESVNTPLDRDWETLYLL